MLLDAALGFDAASCATPAARLVITVPLVVIPLAATLCVAPLPVTIAVVAPAVPPSVTSPVAKSLTGSLNTTSNTIGDALVGSACVSAWLIVTVGATPSNVTVLSVLVDV